MEIPRSRACAARRSRVWIVTRIVVVFVDIGIDYYVYKSSASWRLHGPRYRQLPAAPTSSATPTAAMRRSNRRGLLSRPRHWRPPSPDALAALARRASRSPHHFCRQRPPAWPTGPRLRQPTPLVSRSPVLRYAPPALRCATPARLRRISPLPCSLPLATKFASSTAAPRG
jgi:hypothetical protein